jgi:hypothetical protein
MPVHQKEWTMKPFIFAAVVAAFVGSAAQAAPFAGAQDASPDRVFVSLDGFRAEETPGGYEPANSPLSGPVEADTKVVFVPQTMTPAELYPAPAAKKAYPPCTPQRQDSCRQAQ